MCSPLHLESMNVYEAQKRFSSVQMVVVPHHGFADVVVVILVVRHFLYWKIDEHVTTDHAYTLHILSQCHAHLVS